MRWKTTERKKKREKKKGERKGGRSLPRHFATRLGLPVVVSNAAQKSHFIEKTGGKRKKKEEKGGKRKEGRNKPNFPIFRFFASPCAPSARIPGPGHSVTQEKERKEGGGTEPTRIR